MSEGSSRTCIKCLIYTFVFVFSTQQAQEALYNFWLMTHSHFNQGQVYDSRTKKKKISLYPYIKLQLLSSRSTFISSHRLLSPGTMTALGWWPLWEVNNSFFFLSAHPHLFSFSNCFFFPPLSPLSTHPHFPLAIFISPSFSRVCDLHFTALYLSPCPALLPCRQPPCLVWNVRSALMSLDHPLCIPCDMIISSPLSLCGPSHASSVLPPPTPFRDTHSPLCLPLYSEICPSADEVCSLLRREA